MLSHIVSDLHEAYVEEILKPQLGSDNAPKQTSSGEESAKTSDPGEAAVKRIRQAVYDIRYRARREDIPLDQAFNQYMSHTSMNAVEKKAVREKLGMGVGGGGSSPVKEETQDIEEYAKPGEYYLRVDPRKRGTGEKPYVRKYDPSNPKDVAKRHKLEARGIKTTATKYGTPYEGGSSGAGEKYEKKYGSETGKNTVGDLDKDGTKEPDRHEYAGVKDNAIKKAMAKKSGASKKKTVKEGFSNWRQDLFEISNADDEIESSNEKQIKEKKVDNYSGGKGKRVVTINPQFNESIENLGGHLIESVELSEDFLIETSNNAAEYFFEMGLNEDGLEIVIEDLGLENFVEFVFDISEESLLYEEAQTRLQKKAGGSIKSPKGVRAQSLTKTAIKKHGLTRKFDSESPKGTLRKKILKDKASKSVEKAKETQPSKKPVRDAIARGIFGAVKAYQSGMERHKKAMGLAKETGKTVAKAAKVTHEAGRRAGESNIGKAVKKSASSVGKAVAKKVKSDIETTKKALKKEEFDQIDEVLTAKTSAEKIIKDFVHSKDPKFSGDTKKERINRALGAYYGMHPEKSKKKVDEGVSSISGKPANQQPETTTTQRNTQQNQVKNTQDKQQKLQQQKPQVNPQDRKLANIQKQQLAAKMKQVNAGIPLKDSYEMVDEARAEDKRGITPTGAQRQKQKSGEEGPRGRRPATSYSGGQNPHLRGKGGGNKEQRRAASRRYVDQPGGVYAAPENKQGAKRFAKMQAKKRDQSHMSSRFD